jgi:hypothetical protein
MGGPSEKMRVSDEVFVNCYKRMNTMIFQSEYSSGSEISMKISSRAEQSVGSDEAKNVSDNSSMQPDVWANLGAERPHFPFTGKPGINIDL